MCQSNMGERLLLACLFLLFALLLLILNDLYLFQLFQLLQQECSHDPITHVLAKRSLPGLDSFGASGSTVGARYGFLGFRQSLQSLRPQMRNSWELCACVTTDLSLGSLSPVLDSESSTCTEDYIARTYLES